MTDEEQAYGQCFWFYQGRCEQLGIECVLDDLATSNWACPEYTTEDPRTKNRKERPII